MARAEKPRKEKSKHPLRDLIEMCVFAVVMALGLKVFALEAYQIPTGSMMPTLMGTQLLDRQTQVPNSSIHDRVLVDKLSFLVREPKRWEVVVFRYPLLAYQNYVKRLVGMPGEELMVENGDIWTRPIGSDLEFVIQRKPADLQRRLWKRVFPVPGATTNPWAGWDTSGEHSAEGDGSLTFRGKGRTSFDSIKDVYRHGFPDSIYWRIPVSGSGSRGSNFVHDLRLQLSVTPTSTSPMTAEIQCGPWAFELELDPGSGSYRLLLPDGDRRQGAVLLAAGEQVEVQFAYWDQHFELQIDAGGDRFSETGDLSLASDERARRSGVSLSLPEGGWRLAPPAIERDIHYLSTLQGDGSQPRVFEIPEGYFFMMGDNTQNSHDSRDWSSREIQLVEPMEGRTELIGDDFSGSMDPFFDNPRWNRDHTVMTFRDSQGELFAIPEDQILAYKDLRQPHSLVPRENLMGRALAVFLPLWPTVRIGLVR
ncbi:MAG: signal peptidase I [Planctomycetes bacterium]|nr:signal peptidase I [Planctomycetota bacterium]MBL7007761.1 signal peptidase I [Planctomycetota bacterium]